MKEHQKIEYLECIKNKKLSEIKDEKFKIQLEVSSLDDMHNQPTNKTSLTLSQRGSIHDFFLNELLDEEYIEENMKAGSDINKKFSLTLKGIAYLEGSKKLLRKAEIYLTDYPLIITNSIAFLALIISIIALFN